MKTSDLIQLASQHFNVMAEDVISKTRNREVLKARHVIYYILIQHFGVTLKSASRLFQPHKPDHTNALYARNKVLRNKKLLSEANNLIISLGDSKLETTENINSIANIEIIKLKAQIKELEEQIVKLKKSLSEQIAELKKSLIEEKARSFRLALLV